MTLKRLILGALTIVVVALLGSSLFKSLSEPQITSRLQLYQTDLVLHATELESETTSAADAQDIRKAVLGEEPIANALEQYQKVRKSAQEELTELDDRLQKLSARPAEAPPAIEGSSSTPALPVAAQQLQATARQQQDLINQLDLRIGILQAHEGKTTDAQATWNSIEERSPDQSNALIAAKTAETLSGLWNDPPQLLPDAEQVLQQNLEGWFRYESLARLYELQQREEALAELRSTEQATAEQTLVKLALVGTVPVLGCAAGVGILLFAIGQRLVRGKQSIVATNAGVAWETPWTGETIWQVLILGFFFVGQIALPFVLSLLGISFQGFGIRAKATYALTYYLLMAGSALFILYLSIRKFLPLPEDWFRLAGRSKWFFWGLGGYFAALPLMILVSVINQRIWQGEGGSNPLLQVVLEEGDPLSLGIFFFTAAIAAPLFEETLFRGFLLTSLTRYFPVWGAIALSSVLFAIAHLSLSEVLPLTVLGAMLGFIYTRSRDLLAPMLLHSLWNSVTMISLFILGSGTK